MTTTTLSAFVPPSPGAWELEQTHLTRPISFFAAEIFPVEMMRGFKDGSREYGVLLDHLEIAVINRFTYMAPRPVGAPKSATGVPPRPVFEVLRRVHPEMRRRIRRAEEVFRTRAWRDDVQRWHEDVKPTLLADARALLQDNLEDASDADLAAHVRRATEFARRTIYWHHRYSVPVVLPVGDLLVHTMEWTGMTAGEILQVLRGLSPASAGAVEELAAVRAAISTDAEALMVLLSELAPADIVSRLETRPAPVGPAVRAYLDVVGLRIIGGYDVADVHARELPELLVKIMRAALAADESTRQAQAEQSMAALRERVPHEHRAEFDALLAEAQLTYGLRDERVFYGDGLGMGVARRAILAAGERLRSCGRVHDARHLVDATEAEIVALLEGREGPSADDIAERYRFRLETPLSSAPATLGLPPSPPPPAEWLPGAAARMQRCVDLVLSLMFATHPVEDTGHVAAAAASNGSKNGNGNGHKTAPLKGFAVSPGVYEAPARVIRTIHELPDVQQGEILVTPSTGPTFNVVLPLLGAIVTERGGALSHAAIVAREYGLPGVVGCQGATTAIRTGMRIRVDGTSGEVWISE
jgi:pyruvate,water dikinase